MTAAGYTFILAIIIMVIGGLIMSAIKDKRSEISAEAHKKLNEDNTKVRGAREMREKACRECGYSEKGNSEGCKKYNKKSECLLLTKITKGKIKV